MKNVKDTAIKGQMLKTISLLFLLFFLVSCHDNETTDSNKNPIILFSDNNLAKCVNDTGLPQQKIFQLDCRAYDIKSLGGIEYLNNLENIDLSSNKIVDVSPLAVLIKRKASLNENNATVTTLQNLNLANNQINSASALKNVSNNVVINLTNNPLNNLLAPIDIAAYKRNGAIVLRWQQTPGAIFYNIYRGEKETSIDFDNPVAVSKMPRVLIENLDNDKTYYFYVAAIYPQGEGLLSDVIQGTAKSIVEIPPKSKILYMRASETSIYVDWSDVHDVSSYELRVSSTVDFNDDVKTIENVTPPFEITDMLGNQVYYIQVRAKNNLGESLSDAFPIRTLSPQQEPQIQALLAIPEENEITLEWELGSRYGSARLFYGTTEDMDENSGLEFANPQSPLTHPGLAINITYYYLLLAEANDDDGNELRQLASAKPKSLVSNLFTPDSKLLACINNTGFNYVSDITVLNCDGYGITSLSGIGQLDSLKTLSLRYNFLTDLSPLKGMNSLLELNLYGNQVEDVQPLTELNSLVSVQLQANQVSDITPFQNMTQLSSLGLSDNPIGDISALENLKDLNKLQLSNTEVDNVSPLGELNKLSHLNIANNSIIDIEPLGNLQELVYLDIRGNQITDFAPLNGLLALLYVNTAENREIADNIAPTADANSDQTVVSEQTTILLSAANSDDIDGEQLSYQWRFIEKPEDSNAEIIDADTVDARFDVDVRGTYVVEVKVTDIDGASDTATVSITYPESGPIANAGNDQAFTLGQTVVLDGSSSTSPDGDTLEYRWELLSRPSSSESTLVDSDKAISNLTPDVLGTYQAQLIVSVGTTNSAPDTVTVTSNNVKPVAKAGDDVLLNVASIVQLDGTKSFDIDGQALNYLWQIVGQPENSTAILTNETLARPEFSVDLVGSYIVELSINDQDLESEPDQVTLITALASADPLPTADAGDDIFVSLDDVVNLDGSGSYDIEGQKLSYQWSLVNVPEGSRTVLDRSDKVQSIFTIDVLGQYVAQLIVNDGANESQPNTVTISTNNIAPVAKPGSDLLALIDDTLTLDGSLSYDANQDDLFFRWSLLNKPAESSSELTNSNTSTPSLNIDEVGDYIVQLIVNDGVLSGQPDNVLISTGNLRPVAIIADEQTYTAGDAITLDGSQSFDVNQNPLIYSWSLILQPEFSNQTLSDLSAISPVFNTLWEGDYVVQLVVNDGQLSSKPDTVLINVELGVDDDNDGLNNVLEALYETNPNIADSDGDGLSDGEEVKKYRTNPNAEDSDGDTLSDFDEIFTYQTNPNNEDSDNDGWSDYIEAIEANTDPNSRSSTPLVTVLAMPQSITVLRTGFNTDSIEMLNTVVATPGNINVLRTGEGGAGDLQLNTIVSEPDDINVLRTGEGQAGDLLLNTIIATPRDINILRTGEGGATDLQLNTVVATPDNINVLRTGEGVPGELLLNTIVAEPKEIDVLIPIGAE